MGGDEIARFNLGLFEERSGNMDRALKHYMIAVRSGLSYSLAHIKEMFVKGHATKDNYSKALQSHQLYVDEVRSDQRDEAAAFDHDQCKYY